MILIGLMSGTSTDGIDAVLVEIEQVAEQVSCRLIASVCMPWPADLRDSILDICRPDASLSLVTVLNFRLGEVFAEAAAAVAEAAGVSLTSVDAVASHGQTIWHQPTPLTIGGSEAVGTLQIGEPSVIAARTGRLVVADFRCADMALGGQGAPLVPYMDYRLLTHPHETRTVQNLGGIANVTLLPAGGEAGDVLAFDTGPGNMLLDGLAQRLTGGAQRYDAEGAMALRGEAHPALLEECLCHPYFALSPPKSTGREMFGAPYIEAFLGKANRLGLTEEATMATATALTATSIARAYRDWLLPRGSIQTVILGGGGAHNRALVGMLAKLLAPARLTTLEEFGLPGDAKEAMAFALLAYETLHGRPSNVPSATGASGPAILGKIVLPPGRSARLPL